MNEMNRKPVIIKRNANGCDICISHSGNKGGYPQIRDSTGKKRRLSHVLWEHRYKKSFPSSPFLAMHECDEPQCVRWGKGHLKIGTTKENALDREKKGYWEVLSWRKRKWVYNEKHGTKK